MKLESFLTDFSVLIIAVITLYAFYSFFSGQMDGFTALATLIVTYAAFGFIIGVGVYLASQRREGWRPEGVRAKFREAVTEGRDRRASVLTETMSSPPRYGAYKIALLALVGVGALVGALLSITLGLIIMCTATGSYLVLHAVEILERSMDA